MKPLIVTKHVGMVQWLGSKGIEGEVTPWASAEDVRGRVVYGSHLPIWLAALTERYYCIRFRGGMPEKMKRRELSAEEMDEAGAHIQAYEVKAL